MASRAGISGLAVGIAAAGGFLVYAGVRRVPILEGLRELAAGRLHPGVPATPTTVNILRKLPTPTGAADTDRYKLGAVKPHVAKAANEIGALFDLTTIFGWAPGAFDHPKGLALDFMVYGDKAKGDRIAAYLLANAERLAITYVIWWRRIWSVDRPSWRPYYGVSPHTDHPHASFRASTSPPSRTDPGR